MSETVDVAFGDNPSDQAVLLLAAAEDLGLDPDVVKTTEGGFAVPKEVHDKAFGNQKQDKDDKPKSGGGRRRKSDDKTESEEA
jgi:hypothetical protein